MSTVTSRKVYVPIFRNQYDRSLLVVVPTLTPLRADLDWLFDIHPEVLQSELQRVTECPVVIADGWTTMPKYQVCDIEPEDYAKVTAAVYTYLSQLVAPGHYHVRINPLITQNPYE